MIESYAEKKAARIERMRARAERLDREAARLVTKNRSLLECMNGTPILIGHHSERRHRRDLDRIHDRTRKAIEAEREADRLRSSAVAAEQNRTISSDDPDAPEMLRAKLAGIEQAQALAKAINAAIRGARKSGDARAALAALGIGAPTIERLVTVDSLGNIGVPSFRLTNWSAEARRIRGRIAELEAKASAPTPTAIEAPGVRVVEEENRVRMYFDEKPSEALRGTLRGRGFLWAPSVGAWQRQATPNAWRCGCEVTGTLSARMRDMSSAPKMPKGTSDRNAWAWETAATRQGCYAVACPRCGAEAGEACRSVGADAYLRGGPLVRPHSHRATTGTPHARII